MTARRFPPPWTIEDGANDCRAGCNAQAVGGSRLRARGISADLTRAEADLRIAMLTAKLKLLLFLLPDLARTCGKR